MKPKPEYTEGPEAWERFKGAMRAVLAAPKQPRPKTKKPAAPKG